MGKKRRSFSKDFKLEAVKLIKEGGLSVARAAKDLGVYETSLRRWLKQYEVDQGNSPAGALTTAEKEELRRLVSDRQSHVSNWSDSAMFRSPFPGRSRCRNRMGSEPQAN